MTRRLFPLCALPFLFAAAASAQVGEAPTLGQLGQLLKSPSIGFVALVQATGDYRFSPDSAAEVGFAMQNARLGVGGTLDGGFGYFILTNLVANPAILDAGVSYRAAPWLTAVIGQYKAPFSGEALVGAARLDFVDRARAVTTLAPGRQIGLEVKGALGGGFDYASGLFNGNRSGVNRNDDNSLLWSARLTWRRMEQGEDRTRRGIEVGVHGAYSDDQNATLGQLLSSFGGRRLLVGADFRWEHGPVLLNAEALLARLDSISGSSRTPGGWQATAGYRVRRETQLLVRWDAFRTDGIVPDSDLLILGCNLWPARLIELRLDYLLPVRESVLKQGALRASTQFAF